MSTDVHHCEMESDNYQSTSSTLNATDNGGQGSHRWTSVDIGGHVLQSVFIF
jgi:hypothetical protein